MIGGPSVQRRAIVPTLMFARLVDGAQSSGEEGVVGKGSMRVLGWCLLIGWTLAGCGRSTGWEETMAAGRQALERGDPAEAERLFLAAVAKSERFGADDARPAVALYQLAQAEQAQRKFDRAELHYGQALTRLQQVKGETHPEVAAVLNNLGVLHRLHGQYAEAEPLLKRALAIKEQALGAGHPDVALSLNNLAMVYDTQGRYDQAEPLYQRALAIRAQALGPAHADTAKSRRDYAALLRKMQRDREAATVEASVASPR